MSSWSKLISGGKYLHREIARTKYNANACEYHNWEHVLDCYVFLEENSVPYDEALDKAVMFHDVIYDSLSQKELRSAQFYEEHYGEDPIVHSIIMSTANHSVFLRKPYEIWMIKADLSGLTKQQKTIENYAKIMSESMRLYGIDELAFAKANTEFMKGLLNTMQNNYRETQDAFWLDVMEGIDLTMYISEGIR